MIIWCDVFADDRFYCLIVNHSIGYHLTLIVSYLEMRIWALEIDPKKALMDYSSRQFSLIENRITSFFNGSSPNPVRGKSFDVLNKRPQSNMRWDGHPCTPKYVQFQPLNQRWALYTSSSDLKLDFKQYNIEFSIRLASAVHRTGTQKVNRKISKKL